MSSNAVPPETDKALRLRNFHITFFAIVLGMAAFSLAVQKIAATGGSGILPALEIPATALVYVAIAMFTLTGLTTSPKWFAIPVR